MNAWNWFHGRFRRVGWRFDGEGWRTGTSTIFCAHRDSTLDEPSVPPRCVCPLLSDEIGVLFQESAWNGRQDKELKIGFNDDQTFV